MGYDQCTSVSVKLSRYRYKCSFSNCSSCVVCRPRSSQNFEYALCLRCWSTVYSIRTVYLPLLEWASNFSVIQIMHTDSLQNILDLKIIFENPIVIHFMLPLEHKIIFLQSALHDLLKKQLLPPATPTPVTHVKDTFYHKRAVSVCIVCLWLPFVESGILF